MKTFSARITYTASNAGMYSRTSSAHKVPALVLGSAFPVQARTIAEALDIAESEGYDPERMAYVQVTTHAGVTHRRAVRQVAS